MDPSQQPISIPAESLHSLMEDALKMYSQNGTGYASGASPNASSNASPVVSGVSTPISAPSATPSSPFAYGSDTYGNTPAASASLPPSQLSPLQSYAQQAVASAFPNDPNAWQHFYSVVNRESGWNPSALNQGSGASGLGQFLPSTSQEYTGTNSLASLNPQAQVDATIKYVQARYGNPSQAWASEAARGWY